MTKEDKQLLLKDLCARLPYRVLVHHLDYDEPECFDTIFTSDAWNEGGIMCTVDDSWDSPHDMICCKPYLRPMSSMTEEEEAEYDATFATIQYDNGRYDSAMTYESFDYLNSHHFDCRGLIEKGLAIEAPNDMYKI